MAIQHATHNRINRYCEQCSPEKAEENKRKKSVAFDNDDPMSKSKLLKGSSLNLSSILELRTAATSIKSMHQAT